MPIAERKERERSARIKLILNAALKTFAEKGYHGTSMDLIAECAELGKATIYYYFKSKDDLLLSVLENGIREFFNLMEQEWDATDDLLEKIQAIPRVGARFFADHPNYFKLYYYLTAHPTLNRKAMRQLQPLILEKTRRIQDLFVQAQKSGLLKPFPTDKLVEIFGSLVMGLGQFLYVDARPEVLQEKARLINEIFLNGTRTTQEDTT
ncbi:MAG: TetR/AcrR family transcriptional regulator [Calditrichaeota bacterium]|nr:TetR/AcrR family transcriptional regulator [Calditrichota bacterium]